MLTESIDDDWPILTDTEMWLVITDVMLADVDILLTNVDMQLAAVDRSLSFLTETIVEITVGWPIMRERRQERILTTKKLGR